MYLISIYFSSILLTSTIILLKVHWLSEEWNDVVLFVHDCPKYFKFTFPAFELFRYVITVIIFLCVHCLLSCFLDLCVNIVACFYLFYSGFRLDYRSCIESLDIYQEWIQRSVWISKELVLWLVIFSHDIAFYINPVWYGFCT